MRIPTIKNPLDFASQLEAAASIGLFFFQSGQVTFYIRLGCYVSIFDREQSKQGPKSDYVVVVLLLVQTIYFFDHETMVSVERVLREC